MHLADSRTGLDSWTFLEMAFRDDPHILHTRDTSIDQLLCRP